MNVPFIDLKSQYISIKDEIDAAIKDIIENSRFIMGRPVADFEKRFAKFCRRRFTVGVSSGTTAIHQALLAAGVGKGDEVITAVNTFIATVEPIFEIGAKPVLVDTDKNGLICLDNVKKAISDKTKAIIPVHLYGNVVDIPKLKDIVKRSSKNEIAIIEDCAQAHGAELHGKRVPISGLGCFSFYPGKNLGAYGDAGAVVTDDKDMADEMSMMRDHGRLSKYEHKKIGFNERIDAIQAAILSVKIGYIDRWNRSRRENAKIYSRYLACLKGAGLIDVPEIREDIKSVFHIYAIKCKKRDELQKFLKDNSIETGVHYPIPLHLQPALKHLGYRKGDFPAAEELCSQILSLPMYAELDEKQMLYVCDKIKEFYSHVGHK